MNLFDVENGNTIVAQMISTGNKDPLVYETNTSTCRFDLCENRWRIQTLSQTNRWALRIWE